MDNYSNTSAIDGAEQDSRPARALFAQPGEVLCTLNALNGFLRIAGDGSATFDEFGEHRPRIRSFELPYSYRPGQGAPMWLQFLSEVLPNEDDRANLQEFCGSLFAPEAPGRILCLYGITANGKTVTMDVITRALNGVSHLSLCNIIGTGDRDRVARSALEGKRLNVGAGVDRRITRRNAGIVHALASREPVEARRLYHQPYIMSDYPRIMVEINALPYFSQGTAEVVDDFLFLEFPNRIPESRMNRSLASEIAKAEICGVLDWMIEGLQRMIARGWEYTPNPHAESIAAMIRRGL